MPITLESKTAGENIAITGASRGIGFEVARLFATRGNSSIVATARNRAGLRENIQAHLHPVAFGLEQIDQIDIALVPQEKQHTGSVDINAGLLISKPFEQLCTGGIERMLPVGGNANQGADTPHAKGGRMWLAWTA